MNTLRIFIASPGDVFEERDTVSLVVDELSRTFGDIFKVQLQTVRWETHAWPDIGEDAQDVINREVGDFDIFVGVMWKRFGTPTKRSDSGTNEEFDRAYQYFKEYQRPKIMFYFKNKEFYSDDLKEIAQYKKVIKFKKKLAKEGILYWQYKELLEFERRFREHLTRQIHRLTSVEDVKPTTDKPPRIFISYAREDLPEVEPLYNALKASGFDPWLDVKDILPGQNWMNALQDIIKRSDYFIACVSEKTLDKKGYVHRELKMGLDMIGSMPESETFVIPVRLSPVQPPPELMRFQWVDAFTENGLNNLVGSLKESWRIKCEAKRNK